MISGDEWKYRNGERAWSIDVNYQPTTGAAIPLTEPLVGLIAEAHALQQTVRAQTGSMAQIAGRLGKCRGSLADMMRISYLAPDIVTAIVEGRQPASLKRKTLMATPLSLDWSQQRQQLGFI